MGRKNRAPKVPAYGSAVSKSMSAFNWSRNAILIAILFVTAGSFANTLFNDFAYDDTTQILQNELIRRWSNLPDALTKEVWFWRVKQDKDPNKQAGPTTPYYRPVFTVYLMIGWTLFGTSAFFWHLANILMHLIGVYFVFKICEKISGDLRLTAIATLLFAVHPLRSESVAWISGSTDLFLALFLLPSFYFYMLYREEGRTRNILYSLGLFVLAAFSKEPAVALPIFIGAYELFIHNRNQPLVEKFKPALEYASMFLLPTIFYFAMRFKALGFVLSDANYNAYPHEQVAMSIPLVIAKYIGLLFWPFHLTVFHQTEMVKSPLSYRFYLPLLFVVAVCALLWRLRDSSIARFAILWFAIHLLPVLNLGALAEDFLVQERYVYIPSVGFSLLAGLAFVKIPFEKWLSFSNRRTAQAAVVMLIALIFTGKTLAQNTAWKDDFTLWKHGAAVAEDQPMANFILGHYYVKLQQPQKVIEIFEHYLTLKADNIMVITNLANAHLQMFELTNERSHLTRGIELCEQGLRLNEKSAPLWDTLGHAYTYDTELKNYMKARAYFSRALQYEPDLALSNFHMGATFIKENMLDEGIRYLELAKQQEPKFPDTRKFLGYGYSYRGETQKAVEELTLYTQLQPNALDLAKVKQDIEKMKAKLETAQTTKP
ncbi:MAG: glycosyltransferase family 39 protein [Acidobacteria bacterium]|nr:glycosyltransferase family 39 protein [Acidobacteriota bacterium]